MSQNTHAQRLYRSLLVNGGGYKHTIWLHLAYKENKAVLRISKHYRKLERLQES